MAVWAALPHLGCTVSNLEQINRVSQLTLPECVTPRSDVTYLVSQMSRVTRAGCTWTRPSRAGDTCENNATIILCSFHL